jgi:hypothetical protein
VLLVASGLAQAAVCVVLASVTTPAAVLGLVVLLGAGTSVTAATWQAVLPALAPVGGLARTLSRAQAATTAAGVAAPALSGLLTGAYGARVPLLLDGATFVLLALAGLALTGVRPVGDGVSADPPGAAAGGLAIVRRDPVLRATIGLMGLFALLGSMVNVVEVFLVRATLHAGPTWYGLSGAAYSIGLLGGALWAGRLVTRAALARALTTAAFVLGLGLAAMGSAPDVAWLLVAGVPSGAMNGVLSVAASSLIMGTARPSQRGRVGAVVSATSSASQLSAYVVAALLTGALGPRPVFILAGGLAALAPLLVGGRITRAVARSDTALVTSDSASPAATTSARPSGSDAQTHPMT